MAGWVALASAVFVISAVAQPDQYNNSIPGSSTPEGQLVPPPPAAAVGYKSLVFNDDFDSLSSIDANNTGKPGFNWYIDPPVWGGIPVPLATYSVSNSVLELNSVPAGAWMTSYCIKNNCGHSFRYGYFEARIHFDAALGIKSAGWPAFWALSTYHSRVNNMDHWAELDFFEAYTGGKHDYSGDFVGTVHDWADSSKVHYQNSNNWKPLSKSVDFNKWHTYGCLWGPGKVTWYFDGQALITQNYSAAGFPDPKPNGTTTNAPAGTFSILDTDRQGMLLILGSDPNWPICVDWVRVWQAKAEK